MYLQYFEGLKEFCFLASSFFDCDYLTDLKSNSETLERFISTSYMCLLMRAYLQVLISTSANYNLRYLQTYILINHLSYKYLFYITLENSLGFL